MLGEGLPPPNDLDAEAAVLSSVLIDETAIESIGPTLSPDDFYSEAHRRIFDAAMDLNRQRRKVDIVTVGTLLKDRDIIQQVGGMAYLTELLNAAPVVQNVASYAATVRDKARLRGLIARCQTIAAEGYAGVEDASAYIDQAVQSLHALSEGSRRTQMHSAKDVARKVAQSLKAGAGGMGLPTGFRDLDWLLGGWHPGDVTVLAARPGVGKSAAMLCFAKAAAVHGKGVALFSLEMPKEQLALRYACMVAGVDLGKVRSRSLSPDGWSRLQAGMVEFAEQPISICDTAGLTWLEVRAQARRFKAQLEASGKALGLLAVDYLQLLRAPGKHGSREQEIAEISRELKVTAKDLSVPVLAVAQLNRNVEQRTGKSRLPQLSDLRESGSIEQDADNVIFVHRDSYYAEPGSPEAQDETACFVVSKQRNGSTGIAKARFRHAYTRFEDHEGVA